MEKRSNAHKIVVLGEGMLPLIRSLGLHFVYSYCYINDLMYLARVGKTSLTVRFCKNAFDETQESTRDATYLEKTISV